MIRFKKSRDVKSPLRANATDAGIDFFIPNDYAGQQMIQPGQSINVPSGIHIEILPGTTGLFLNKSGIAKKGLIIGAQVIDCGYTGEVHLNLWNVGTDTLVLSPGQKVAQMLITSIETPALTQMKDDEEFKTFGSDRGDGAFGSTGTD